MAKLMRIDDDLTVVGKIMFGENSINLEDKITELQNGLKRLGNVIKFIAGTRVVKGTGGTSAVLLTNSEVTTITGVTSNGAGNTSVFASNGDGSAQAAHMGCTYRKGSWYAVFDEAIPSGNEIRVNYIIAVFSV